MSSYPIATIDLSALKSNLQLVKKRSPKSKIMSVIKANAYGHGAIEVAHALSESDAFAVARLTEGVLLRQAGISQPIVILEGLLDTTDYQQAAEYDLSPVFNDLTQIHTLIKSKLTQPLSFCWLMIETGMHRLGIMADEIEQALRLLNDTPAIKGDIGLMSHFANADLVDDPRNQQQISHLQQYAALHNSTTSMANSGAILSMPEHHGDWVRPGLILYGISPFEDQSAEDIGLKRVMKLHSVLTAIKTLHAGDEVGYGGDWVAEKTMQIGIVSIGYGDGYSRQLSPSASVLIQNKLVPILGRISMDMIAIDLSTIDNAILAEEVILWGESQLTIEHLSQQANILSYELVCQVSERVKRVYYYGEN